MTKRKDLSEYRLVVQTTQGGIVLGQKVKIVESRLKPKKGLSRDLPGDNKVTETVISVRKL